MNFADFYLCKKSTFHKANVLLSNSAINATKVALFGTQIVNLDICLMGIKLFSFHIPWTT
jgi:hypothetical protein